MRHNALMYPNYDVIKIDDIMIIKICLFQQMQTKHLSNESSLQDESNDVFLFFI